jgi:hypothetical protein
MKDPIASIAEVVNRAEQRINALTPPGPSSVRDVVAKHSTPLFAAWRDVQAAVDALRVGVAATRGDTRWADAERQRQVDAIVNTASTTITASIAVMQSQAQALETALSPMADMRRPEPVDAASEARLANMKADVQLVTSPLGNEGDATDRLLRYLDDASANADELGVWLIASSGWPAMLIESRNFNVARFEQRLDEAVSRLIQGDAATARRVVAELRGGEGLTQAIHAASHYVSLSFVDLGVKVAA